MRHQRPRGSTTRDAVVNAALEVVDRVGIDALTIRAVASAVGAPPMSLYTHFANKEELLDLMHAEMARRLYADPRQDTWQSQLLALGRQVRQTLLAHPNWARLFSRPAQPIEVTVREQVLRLMVDAGMSPEDALSSFSGTVLMAIGLTLAELTFREPDGSSTFSQRFTRIKGWLEREGEAGPEPTSSAAFAATPDFDLGKTFEYTLNTLVSGIELTKKKRADP